MKPGIGIDIDNTLADVNHTLLGLLPGLDLKTYPAPGVSEKTFLKNPWLFTEAPPIPGAVQAARYLSIHWEIIYLTARPEWSRGITESWLSRYRFPKAQLVMTGDKGAEARRLGISLAVDDAPHEIKKLAMAVPVCIFRQTYNEGLSFMGQSLTWQDKNWAEVLMGFYPARNPLALGLSLG